MTAPVKSLRPAARTYKGSEPRLRQVTELVVGDQVVYVLRGRLVSETVISMAPVTTPAGWVAVRFVGRSIDVHYPVHTQLQVAR